MTEQQTTDGLRQALQELLDALPTGVVLTFGNSPIDHTRLNEAKYKAEQALDAHPAAKAAVALSSPTKSMDIWQAYAAAQDEIAALKRELGASRAAAIEECVTVIGNLRQSGAGLFDAKHSGQRGQDRSDALYDAYQALRALQPATPATGGQHG